jgi:Flp pilus assembly protein TadG
MNILKRRSRGQIAIITVLALPALLGALALTCDMTVMYVTWANLQKAADAAVLAGGASLPSDTTQAASDVTSYLKTNGVNTPSEIASGPTFGQKLIPNDTVSVTVKRTVNHAFGRVLGLYSADVQVTATAWAQPSASVKGLIPIGLSNLTSLCLTCGTPITIFGSESKTNSSGNFGALGLTNSNSGASGFATTVGQGYNGTVSVQDSVPTQTGVMDMKTLNAFQGRITSGLAENPNALWDSHPAGDPRDVVIPMVDWTGSGGASTPVPVITFVHLWLMSATGHGAGANPLTITGIPFMESADSPIGGKTVASSNVFRPILIR